MRSKLASRCTELKTIYPDRKGELRTNTLNYGGARDTEFVRLIMLLAKQENADAQYTLGQLST